MNDTNDDPTFGKVCLVCGDPIGANEGHEVDWGHDIIAFVHKKCA